MAAEIVPCRGRHGLPESYSENTFSKRQLDEIVPLTGEELSELGEFSRPEPETIERINKRIEAARMLKYGR